MHYIRTNSVKKGEETLLFIYTTKLATIIAGIIQVGSNGKFLRGNPIWNSLRFFHETICWFLKESSKRYLWAISVLMLLVSNKWYGMGRFIDAEFRIVRLWLVNGKHILSSNCQWWFFGVDQVIWIQMGDSFFSTNNTELLLLAACAVNSRKLGAKQEMQQIRFFLYKLSGMITNLIWNLTHKGGINIFNKQMASFKILN